MTQLPNLSEVLARTEGSARDMMLLDVPLLGELTAETRNSLLGRLNLSATTSQAGALLSCSANISVSVRPFTVRQRTLVTDAGLQPTNLAAHLPLEPDAANGTAALSRWYSGLAADRTSSTRREP